MSYNININQSSRGGGGRRLTRDRYKAEGASMQSQMTDEEICERLENYEQVDDIDYVGMNSHVRYFVKTKDQKRPWLFRLGGFLKKKDNPKYVVLSTSPGQDGKTWSVNRETAIFWRIKSKNEQVSHEQDKLVQEYQSTLQEQQAEIEALRAQLKKQVTKKPPTDVRSTASNTHQSGSGSGRGRGRPPSRGRGRKY